MEKQLDIIRKGRDFLCGFIADMPVDALNVVPQGFSNNIIWNLGHLIAAQQGVCYKRAGIDMVVEEGLWDMYRPGSRPEQTIGLAEVERIRQLLQSTIDRLEEDYKAGIFGGYTPWTTRYGVDIAGIDDALAFLPFHEGMHTGYIMALKRAVGTAS